MIPVRVPSSLLYVEPTSAPSRRSALDARAKELGQCRPRRPRSRLRRVDRSPPDRIRPLYIRSSHMTRPAGSGRDLARQRDETELLELVDVATMGRASLRTNSACSGVATLITNSPACWINSAVRWRAAMLTLTSGGTSDTKNAVAVMASRRSPAAAVTMTTGQGAWR